MTRGWEEVKSKQPGTLWKATLEDHRKWTNYQTGMCNLQMLTIVLKDDTLNDDYFWLWTLVTLIFSETSKWS